MKIVLLVAVVASFVNLSSQAFVFPRQQQHRAAKSNVVLGENTAALQRRALGGLEFQLEEREDVDTEATDIWLNPDGSVTVGQTDGPPVVAYEGKWSILETASEADKPFRMRLDRSYEGKPTQGTRPTDMGEFQYHVKREFWGNVQRIGDQFQVEGVIHGLDNDRHEEVVYEVGYFALIDSSKEMSEVREIKAEISNTLRLDWVAQQNQDLKCYQDQKNIAKAVSPGAQHPKVLKSPSTTRHVPSKNPFTVGPV